MIKEKLKYSQVSLLTDIKRHTLNARARTLFEKNQISRSPGNQALLSPSQVRKLIEDCCNKLYGKVIYIGNLKGGVGKTTLSYLLASAASCLGIKTCAIDLDVQANLTKQFIDQKDNNKLVFLDLIEDKAKISDITIKLSENFDFIPSSLKNSLIQKALSMQSPKNHSKWLNDLCLNHLRETYELIIIDTPPQLTTLNSVFCLCLNDSDNVLIPACAEQFSVMGVQMFLDDIISIRQSYEMSSNPNITIVMNRFMQNQKNNLQMLVEMGETYQGMLSEVIIKDSARIKEMINNRTPVSQVKQRKEIYETIRFLLEELKILKQ
jgi:chromosome partitioning protein